MSEIQADTVVLGAGPAGYVCAIRLAQYGKKVVVVEEDDLGGTCLNWGCIPSKALISAGHFFEQAEHASTMGFTVEQPELDLSKLIAWKDGVVKKLTGGIGMLFKSRSVDWIKGSAVLVDGGTVSVETPEGSVRVKARDIVIAAGSEPAPIPGFDFGDRVWSSTEALSPEEIPQRLLVIGGGVIGLELGMFYAQIGSEVVVVEATDSLLPGTDPDLVKVVARKAKKLGVKVHTNAFARSWEDSAGVARITVEISGEESVLEADRILLSVGRRPRTKSLGLESAGVKVDERGFISVNEQCQTSASHVYAIGDLTHGPMLAHKGSAQGLVAAAAIAEKAGAAYDKRVIPSVIFTDPEIASVGLTEAEALEQNIEIKVGRFNFGANGRALSIGKAEGLIKVVSDAGDDTLLGVHMVGPNVTDLIAEAALAMESGLTTEDITLTVHPHPTLNEVFMEACEDVHNLCVHSPG
ncbi:MAG TPA: dihydrolipoyl dehydrogenase [Planctomycetes bacterium]|nr:dihydrolipoyl dehydrogenase [Planctomycetota bacterium]